MNGSIRGMSMVAGCAMGGGIYVVHDDEPVDEEGPPAPAAARWSRSRSFCDM
jgi:hypothetical protein